jgi:hypothetical protein
MALIGNEIKYCEKHLQNNTIDDNPIRTVAIMIKYFYLVQGLEVENIKSEIENYLDRVGATVSEEVLDSLLSTCTGAKASINALKSISITVPEWELIQEIGRNERERKVLFTLLCMYKIKVGVGFANDGTVKVDYTKLNSDAHVTMTKAYRTEMLQHMESVGMINIDMGQIAKKIKLNYVREGEELIQITEFDCIHVYYEHLKEGNKKLIYCEDCGDLVTVKGNARTKVCKKCAKKRAQECKNEYHKRAKEN